MDAAIQTNSAITMVAIVGFSDDLNSYFQQLNFHGAEVICFENGMRLLEKWSNESLDIRAIISHSEILSTGGLSLIETIRNRNIEEVPFFLVVNYFNANLRLLALSGGVTDVFKLPLDGYKIEKRVNFNIANWTALRSSVNNNLVRLKPIGWAKRSFDIFFAGLAIIMLSPVLIIVSILIRLESKGPIFYYSPRAGTGFKIFPFYKFRSMYVNADARIKELKHLNQYDIDAQNSTNVAAQVDLCNNCSSSGKCQYPLYSDGVQWCEKDTAFRENKHGKSAFFKIMNDPRITKVGNFIRNTSIDELPQLWNVIRGDMSIVGNRPLPLYEAEKLTTDKYVLRFAAPAGITGLWQVEKRGKGNMSEEERLLLDNTYAKNQSFANDLKLILKTIPALFQKENV
ncbi:sugar transferase [Pedobacter sp. MC2016-05]|uniref:sugar transferase n=1 Tax=Pedobacter sp. MC2016-05 TaxID=2994474 RepID=UPI002AFFB1EB|nr:sugar transferase [Pedobacter sp. MC2016-05]